MIPRPGETAGAWWENTGYRPEVGVDDPIAAFLHDVSPPIAAEAARVERGQASAVMDDPWPLDAWPDVATTVIAGARDRLFPLDYMRGLARSRLGLDEVTVVDAGHLPALSRPEDLARAILTG
jgi:pimeloyl-ACP methyl ester carboxylesterase